MYDLELQADNMANYEECCKEEFIDYVNELINTANYLENL